MNNIYMHWSKGPYRNRVIKAIKKNAHTYKGSKNPNWKGGRINVKGYILVYAPGHPSARNGYVYEHRLVAEKTLNRILRMEEVVHHLNGKKSDNRPENLRVMTKSEHAKEHGGETWTGRKHRQESIERIRSASTGRRHSKEAKKKISKTHKGKKRSGS